LTWGTHRQTTPPRMSEEEELLGLSKEEEEPPVGVEEDEESPPTSPLSCPIKPAPGMMEEERCGGGWSFPPLACAREDERCGGGWSFPPRGMREEERCGLREKQTSRSSLGSASSRAPSAC
jgi:hypothetical protein